MSTLREQVLSKQVMELRATAAQMQRVHLSLLCTITHYVGGQLTLTEDDFNGAKGLLLTQQIDPFTKAITFRVRMAGKDGGSEGGCDGHTAN